MMRFLKLSVIGLAAIAAANAGQIQIGGVNGLSSDYITAPNTIAGQNTSGCPGGVTCLAGATTLWTKAGYDATLFSGALNGATAPVPYFGYTSGGAQTGTMSDNGNGVIFAMINDGNSNNFWQASSNTANSITIPVGIFGVTDVWTMLNAELAGAGAPSLRDANVSLIFGATPNATTGLTTVLLKFANSNSPYNASPSGQIQDSVLCSSGSGCTGTATGNTDGAVGPTLASSTSVGITGLTGATATVKTNNLYSFAYNSATGRYTNTAGSVVLDDQGIVFGGTLLTTSLNSYLVSVKIADPLAVSGSYLALSAVTVDAVPEPSTVMLSLTGFGLLAFAAWKKRSVRA